MGRVQLFETADLAWFPQILRDHETDLLADMMQRMGPYDAAAPLIVRLLDRAGVDTLTDLGSGGAGPWVRLLPILSREAGRDVRVRLTDLRPNIGAFERVSSASGGKISFERSSVDATSVGIKGGVRTMFSVFHHFPPELARGVLADARESRAAIGVFEFNRRAFASVAVGLVMAPLHAVAMAPFIRPFRLSSLLLTYVLPVTPLNQAWNGLISNLRTYSPDELRDLCRGLDGPGYDWEIGCIEPPGRRGPAITYLLGLPG